MIPFKYIDQTLAFLGFAFLIGSLNALLTTFDSSVGGANSSGNLKIQMFSMMIYGPTAFLIVYRLGRFLHLFSQNIIIFLFLGLPIFSVFWSIAPDVSIRRIIALTGTMLFIAYISISLTPERALRVLATTFGIVALVSFAFAVALPGIGTHESGPYAGVWRGMFAHKNKLGGMMALGAATIMVCPKYNQKEVILGFLCALIAVLLVVMSQSKTALVILCTLAVLIPLIHWVSGRGLRTLERIVLVSTILIVGITAAVQHRDEIFSSLGKDATLTGRTDTWSLAWENFLDRPVFGHGYRVFWSDKSPARLSATESWRDKISHSHNTYLDLALDLGLLGVIGFLAVLMLFMKRLSRRIREKKDKVNLWMVIFAAYMLVVGITERSILEQSDIVWSIFVLSFFYLSFARQTSNKAAPTMASIEFRSQRFSYN